MWVGWVQLGVLRGIMAGRGGAQGLLGSWQLCWGGVQLLLGAGAVGGCWEVPLTTCVDEAGCWTC